MSKNGTIKKLMNDVSTRRLNQPEVVLTPKGALYRGGTKPGESRVMTTTEVCV
jgi:hypothetical protein